MSLTGDFCFVDPTGKRWSVPTGARTDGASIPRFLWSFLGGPYEGAYRTAAVVHDWYCDVRTEPSEAVHEMFYHAMIAGGVGEREARVKYAGVRMFGPKWSQAAMHNTRLFGGDANFSSGIHYREDAGDRRPPIPEDNPNLERDIDNATSDLSFEELQAALRWEDVLTGLYDALWRYCKLGEAGRVTEREKEQFNDELGAFVKFVGMYNDQLSQNSDAIAVVDYWNQFVHAVTRPDCTSQSVTAAANLFLQRLKAAIGSAHTSQMQLSRITMRLRPSVSVPSIVP